MSRTKGAIFKRRSLHLFQRSKTPAPKKECPEYDTKTAFDGEVSVLEIWGVWSKPSMPLLPGPVWTCTWYDQQILFRIDLWKLSRSKQSLNYYISCEVFTSANADGLSLESEWHQVFSRLQDSSQYSGRFLTLLGFGWFRFILRFPTLQFLFPSLYLSFLAHYLQLVSSLLSYSITFFSSLARSNYLSVFYFYLIFNLCSIRTAKFTIR